MEETVVKAEGSEDGGGGPAVATPEVAAVPVYTMTTAVMMLEKRYLAFVLNRLYNVCQCHKTINYVGMPGRCADPTWSHLQCPIRGVREHTLRWQRTLLLLWF